MSRTFYAIAALAAAILLSGYARAQSFAIPGCNMAGTGPGANYSATVGNSSVTLIPAPRNGVARTGIFIELLSANATLAVNPTGPTASTTAPGNIVVTTASSAPNNIAYINFAAMGFVPQGAITAIADASGRVVSAWACPE